MDHGKITGRIRVGDRTFGIQPDANGTHRVIEYDASTIPVIDDDARHPPSPAKTSPATPTPSNSAPAQTDAWIEKYIFPNSMIPAASQVATALEDLFVVEDWHNFGTDYDRTLVAWSANFEAAWPALSTRYDERFRRMWRYYLAVSTAVFRSRRDQLWQITLSPRGVPGGYRVPR